jgi:hypothetical protein
MTTVFWGRKRVLIVEFMQQGTTITYCETLGKMSRTGHSETRRGMPTYSVMLLLDNARPHTAARTGALLEHFSWELFDHHPYKLILAPRDYNLFTYLKN